MLNNKYVMHAFYYCLGTTTPPLNSMPTTDPFGGFSYLDALRGNMSGNGLTNLNMGDFRQQIEQQMLQNPEMFRQIVNNPLVQNIMSDPENIRLFVTSNPQMRELIDVSTFFLLIIQNVKILKYQFFTEKSRDKSYFK